MNPIKASLKYPAVTLFLTFALLLAGMQAILYMPRMEDPSMTIRTGIVAAYYPGATSDQVESQLAKKIEDRLFKFAEVRKEKTYSTSRPGVLVVNVELQDNVKNSDQFWAKLRHDLSEARTAGEFPSDVIGPIVDSDFGDTVALLVAVHGNRYGYQELKEYAERIEDELRTIPDVAKLHRYGEQKEQIWITSSLQRLSQYLANPARIVQALQQRNIIKDSGALLVSGEDVPLKTNGLLVNEDQIKRILVDVSPSTGQPVYIRDFADVERRYQDPDAIARFDGEPSVLLSVEMQKGRNIVELGEQINVALARLRPLLPPDLKLDLIADQPSVVHERIEHLEREFLLAIGSVILVTIILLPLRVAVIAATAIPVTVATTLGVLDAVGIPLHQVSIAGLIVSLGILVDDAIVIADNYIELLDHKVPRAEAAWRSASDMIVPVLTATLTIIASFLPLITLSGSPGEFVIALPVTVAIGLACSFAVAMLLTPLLCRFFIKQGLHSDGPRKGFNILDFMQTAYNRAIALLMARKIIAIGAALAAIAGGVVLLRSVPQQFFPFAERNQFVIDLWMPPVSRLEETDRVIQQIQSFLAKKPEVEHVAAFAGQSFPRFYYNVNPQQPDRRYGQLIVITKSAEETPAFVKTLRSELTEFVPEGLVIVKELQQGSQIEAPVEVRISGDDIGVLKNLGNQVESILRDVPFATYVHNDYYEDSWMVGVNVRPEEANRLGLTNAGIAQQLAGAFSGADVTTFWEGERRVNVLLRLGQEQRRSFDDVRNAYITSNITGQRVPLRSVADLEPQWQTTRIVKRNGVQTLTVRSFPTSGHYGSQILAAIDSKVKSIALPSGYRIAYGGEIYEQNITFAQLLTALGISLACIFLVLLFQFRTISEPLVVMAAIPLSLFGAAMGLVVTHNPFGFTAFMGCIALSGIVVRNSIILVDYINEKRREGSSLEQAALEAGERRLRPIFLTTMAAAVGVMPMILSGSSLWSPLASVLASGLIFSMFFVLLVVPVLFVIVERRREQKHDPHLPTEKLQAGPVLGAILLCLVAVNLHAQSARKITLTEAVDLALNQNSDLKIIRQKIQGSQYRVTGARADELPRVKMAADDLVVARTQSVSIPAGSLGVYSGVGPLPASSVAIDQGNRNLLLGTVTVEQPLTQLIKLRAARRAVEADVRVSQADLHKAEDEVGLRARTLYFQILIGRLEAQAATLQITAADRILKENTDAVLAGNVLEVASVTQKTNLLQAKYQLRELENQVSDLTAQLNELMGLPIDSELDLEPVVGESNITLVSLPEYTELAMKQNPAIQSAIEAVDKARQGVRGAKAEYIPNVGVFGQYAYQNGVPFLVHNNATFGVRMSWDLFDWGKRSSSVGEKESELAQALENVERLKKRTAVRVEKSYHDVELAKEMLETARSALYQAQENSRLVGNRYAVGLILASDDWKTKAGEAYAKASLLRADLSYVLAKSELDVAVGSAPR